MNRMFESATAFDHSLSAWDISSVITMDRMFEDAGLSQSNVDATLTSWAAQSVQSNVPLHIGVKTYTSAGAAALATLRDTYNWTITEHYLLTYDVGDNATLTGTSTQQLNSGDNGTEVTVVPNTGYRFLSWSDGITTPTRTDTNITDNRTLTAQIEKIPSPAPGTNASRQIRNLEEMGNKSAADALRVQFLGAVRPLAPSHGQHGRTFDRPEQRLMFMAILLTLFGLER